MCSISVEPTPSRMSTPKRGLPGVADLLRAAPRRPRCRCAGAASRSAACLGGSSSSIAAESVGTPKKMVGWYLLHQRETRPRRRPLGDQHGGGADRHRKRQRVAEAVGEEQLCRREDDVVLANAEHALAVESRRRDRGWNARAARPSACRSSPTSRARTRARRRSVAAGSAAGAARRRRSSSFWCGVRRLRSRDDDVHAAPGGGDRGFTTGSSGAETNRAGRGNPRAHRRIGRASAAC